MVSVLSSILIGSALAIGISGIGSAIGLTMAAKASEEATSEHPEKFGTNLVFTVLAETPVIYGLLIALILVLNSQQIVKFVADGTLTEGSVFWGVIGAGMVVGITGFFSAIGIGIAGATGITASTEKSSLFGKSLVFTVLPETVVIYGLLIAILILRTIGVFGDPKLVQPEVSLFFSALVMCFVSITGYLLGKLGSTAIKALTVSEDSFGKNIVFVVLVESVAIYGLLVSILILQNLGAI